jgi:starch synthase
MIACDVYVQPSRFEAFGIAIVEAMAAERPVVASAVDGIREVVAHGETGVLVPPNDPAALAAALIDLEASAAARRQMGERGRHRAATLFGVETWVRRTGELYRRLVAPTH